MPAQQREADMKAFVAYGKRSKKLKARKKAARRPNSLPLIIGNPFKRRTKTMAKAKRKNATRRHRRAGKNPLVRVRRRRTSRNPLELAGQGVNENLKLIAGAAGGLFGNIHFPAMALALVNQPDTGIPSYLVAALAAIVPAYLLQKINWSTVAKGWLAGAGAALAWRVYSDVTGQGVVTVSSGMGSFLTQQQVCLPGGNLFGQYGRKGLQAGSVASPMALSAPVSKGVGYVKYAYSS
jgi:hypothetical protein